MKNKKVHLQYAGTFQYNNELWFSNMGFNGLYSLSLEDYSLKFRGIIPFLDLNVKCAYIFNFLLDDNLYFFPNCCNQIMKYDMKNQVINKILIGTNEIFATVGVLGYKDQIWIIPQNLKNEVYVLSMINDDVKKDAEITNKMLEMGGVAHIIHQNDKEVVVLSATHKIYSVNMETKEIMLINNFEKNVYAIRYDGKNYWILLKDSTDICEWDPIENTYITYHLETEEWITTEGIPYGNIVFACEQVIILSNRLKYIMKINKEKRIISKAFDYPKGFRFLTNIFDGWSAFSCYDVIENKILIHPFLSNMLLIYDLVKNTLEGKELFTYISDSYIRNTIENFNHKNKIFYERDDIGNLEDFIEIIGEKRHEALKLKDNVGKLIYESK